MQAAQQANIEAQAQANAQAAEAAALAETQKQQVLTEQNIQYENAKKQFDIEKLEAEANIKQRLMAVEFDYNLRLAEAKVGREKEREQFIEDRKDQRTKLEGTQQSQMIEQRKSDGLPINFESVGNDTLGGIGLEQFDPQ